MQTKVTYPTPEHERAAEAITSHFAARADIEAVLLAGSTARGKASRDSCLDITVLVRPDILATHRDDIERQWTAFYESDDVFRAMRSVGKYTHVDLDVINGCFVPGYHGWTSGPDEFELEIGNALVYSVPLWQRGTYLAELEAHWLPYYGEDLRRERLARVRYFCLNNLDHIPLFVERGLYFQSFNRLYDAYREFLQALFITRRVYPIAYDKWIREQIEEILGLPELYQQLPRLFEIEHFESKEIARKAEQLHRLVEQYVECAGHEDMVVSPHLAHPEQTKDFCMDILEEPANTNP
jgi:predicted nucleotidyltransferase